MSVFAGQELEEHLAQLHPGDRILPREQLCREWKIGTRTCQYILTHAQECGFVERQHRQLFRTTEPWWAKVTVPTLTMPSDLYRVTAVGGGKRNGKHFTRVWTWYFDGKGARDKAQEKYRRLLASKRGCLVRLEGTTAQPWREWASGRQEYVPTGR